VPRPVDPMPKSVFEVLKHFARELGSAAAFYASWTEVNGCN
jgi:hypothetical protein